MTSERGQRVEQRRANFRGFAVLVFTLLIVGTATQLAASVDAETEGTLTARVKVNPITVTVLLPDGGVLVGDRFAIEVTVENQGDVRIRDLDVTLHILEEPAFGLNGSTTHHRGLLRPQDSLSTTWRLRALESTTDPPVAVVVVVASVTAMDATDREVFTTESTGVLLEIH